MDDEERRGARGPSRRAVIGAGLAGAVAGAVGAAAPLLDVPPTSTLTPAGRAVEASNVAVVDGRPPAGLQRVVRWVPTAASLVALTFDDGPDAELTPRVLDLLARHGARATFDITGDAALRHPALLREVVAAGHELGNHTRHHHDLAFLTEERIARELRDGVHAIEDVVQAPVPWFRPPRGSLPGAALRTAAELGQDVLLWSVTRGPGGPGTPAMVRGHLLDTVRTGDVVGLHDGTGFWAAHPGSRQERALRERRRVELAALPEVLAGLTDRGFRLVPAGALVASLATTRVPLRATMVDGVR
ncbi:MAG: polysaccharide deacetylase family protein [Motilibacteraceae bacterium]